MVNANEGPEPSIHFVLERRMQNRRSGSPLPYPTLPRKPIVSEEKIDFSTEKPVLISDALPNPSDAAPARNDNVPFSSRSAFSGFDRNDRIAN